MRFASSAALSSTREKAAETVGCCCIPWTDGFAFSAASACARNSAASGTSCCGSSWSSNARSRCSGYSSGLPIRRASSCAAATASWLLSVSLLKSMSPVDCSSHFRDGVRHQDVGFGNTPQCGAKRHRSVTSFRAWRLQRLMSDTETWPLASRRNQVDGRCPRDEVAAVLAMHLADRVAHLALHAVERPPHALHLVLQLHHLLHSREVQAEVVRQLLDQPQPLDVRLGIQPRVSCRALRTDQPFAFVDAKRLRMHADDVGGNGDHVTRTVVHHRPSFRRRSSSSLRRMITNITRTPTVPTPTRTIAAVFTRRAPPADRHARASATPRAPRAPSS